VTTGSRSDVAPTAEQAGIANLQGSAPARPRPFRQRLSIPVALRFPILVLVVVLVLGSLKLNGSSISVYAGPESGPIAGRARNPRTDEWWVRTPLLARQVALGLPDHDELGVGEHDMGVAYDLPTRGWELFVRPHTLPYHVLGIERAFAFEWWIVFLALPVIGLYSLALILGVRMLTAALIAMIVVLSPVVQWWTVSATGTTIGYACLGSAAFIAAVRARSALARIGLAALAGWLVACLVLVLYPPWVLPLLLIVGVTAAAAISVSYPSPGLRRAWWVRLFTVCGIAAAVSGVAFVAFLVAHGEAMEALTSSVYPGQRRSSAGTGDLRLLFGAPFDLIESTRSDRALTVNGMNQSEAAAGLFTVLAVAVAVVANLKKVPWKPSRSRVVLFGLLSVSGVLLAWYLLPIPDGIGRVTLFDRVRPDRVLLPLAVASALALALFLDRQHRSGKDLHPFALALAVLAFAVPTLWAGLGLRIDGTFVPRWQVLLLTAVCTVGVGLALRGTRLGLWILVALFAASAATINPLQRGLAPLVESPSAHLGRDLRARPDAGAVLDFWGDRFEPRGGLTASGVKLVSGVNLYPDEVAWRVLDPTQSRRRAWDRYNNAVWSPGPPGSEPLIDAAGDTVWVTVDPCDPRLAQLGVGTVVSIVPLTYSCLVETDRRPGENGTVLHAYRIVRH
jgi:hypothetical protein